MKQQLVIYHANCYDGFTAAWIARQAMPGCELFEGRYGEPPPRVVGREVYVIDFSYSRDVMEGMNLDAASLVVLDHHKTAQEACEGLEFCEFDMDRSGAGIAWDYFYPETERPWLIDRVEDRDLWRFLFDDTKNAHAYLTSIPMTLAAWDNAVSLTSREVIAEGSAISRSIDIYCQKASQEARLLVVGPHCVVAVNVPYQNASEMADRLLATEPNADYSMGYFQRADGKWQYSLRSRSTFDVSGIAKQYGGGGHAQAAGFETAQILPELIAGPTP